MNNLSKVNSWYYNSKHTQNFINAEFSSKNDESASLIKTSVTIYRVKMIVGELLKKSGKPHFTIVE